MAIFITTTVPRLAQNETRFQKMGEKRVAVNYNLKKVEKTSKYQITGDE